MARPRVAVLGGGIQGCCVALALALRGARPVLFDKNATLLAGATLASEGKVHLGYVYAGDTSLATARMMITGGLAFAPLMERYLGRAVDFGLSTPFHYVVHSDSQKSVDEIGAHLRAVHTIVRECSGNHRNAYFGIPLEEPSPLPADEFERTYANHVVRAGFRTVEVAVNSPLLVEAARARIAADPAIEVRLKCTVDAVEQDGNRPLVVAIAANGRQSESFDHVVNCLWDGRLAIDAKRGTIPDRPWLHRFKYGVRFRTSSQDVSLPSTTVMLGPFGDTVAYADGSYFLSWYPSGMLYTSSDVIPPKWSAIPDAHIASRVVSESLAGLATVLPELARLSVNELSDVNVMGGVIFAWGSTDIDDPHSALHRRYEIGVTSTGSYHSIDPGKLTMAPYFASVCADRIMRG